MIDVALLPSLTTPESFAGKTVIVVDVLRATTTIATALKNGCERILPQGSIESAKQKFADLQADPQMAGRVLIGGERGGKIVEGFHQGNSPIEYTEDVIGGKTLILATTNGTVAMECCRQADRVLIGSMVNLNAVAQAVIDTPQVTVLCSGTDRLMTSEDVLFAGAFVDRLIEIRKIGQTSPDSDENTSGDSTPVGQLTDPASIAQNHWCATWARVESGEKTLADFFRNARGGINLARIGHNPDIEFAANIDTIPVVPELKLGTWEITLSDDTNG